MMVKRGRKMFFPISGKAAGEMAVQLHVELLESRLLLSLAEPTRAAPRWHDLTNQPPLPAIVARATVAERVGKVQTFASSWSATSARSVFQGSGRDHAFSRLDVRSRRGVSESSPSLAELTHSLDYRNSPVQSVIDAGQSAWSARDISARENSASWLENVAIEITTTFEALPVVRLTTLTLSPLRSAEYFPRRDLENVVLEAIAARTVLANNSASRAASHLFHPIEDAGHELAELSDLVWRQDFDTSQPRTPSTSSPLPPRGDAFSGLESRGATWFRPYDDAFASASWEISFVDDDLAAGEFAADLLADGKSLATDWYLDEPSFRMGSGGQAGPIAATAFRWSLESLLGPLNVKDTGAVDEAFGLYDAFDFGPSVGADSLEGGLIELPRAAHALKHSASDAATAKSPALVSPRWEGNGDRVGNSVWRRVENIRHRLLSRHDIHRLEGEGEPARDATLFADEGGMIELRAGTEGALPAQTSPADYAANLDLSPDAKTAIRLEPGLARYQALDVSTTTASEANSSEAAEIDALDQASRESDESNLTGLRGALLPFVLLVSPWLKEDIRRWKHAGHLETILQA